MKSWVKEAYILLCNSTKIYVQQILVDGYGVLYPDGPTKVFPADCSLQEFIDDKLNEKMG